MWSWKFVIQWSWEFKFDDLFLFWSKKRPRIMITWSYKLQFLWSMIKKAVISWFWSQQILWSRDFDLRKTVILNFKIIISRDPVILIPTISVITVIMDHRKWILMCVKISYIIFTIWVQKDWNLTPCIVSTILKDLNLRIWPKYW